MATDSLHPDTDRVRKDETSGLSTSRADFAATLPRRVEAVVAAIEALEHTPDASSARDNLLRRIHALSASAKVLGFAAAADVLARVEQRIRTSQVDTLLDDLKLSRKNLTDLPAMIHRGSYSIAPSQAQKPPSSLPPSEPPKSNPPPIRTSFTAPTTTHGTSPSSAEPFRPSDSVRGSAEPFCVLLFGSTALEQSLLSASSVHSGLDITSTTNLEELPKLAAAIGPDVLLLDATQGSLALLVEELSQFPETSGIPIVALNVPNEIAARLTEQGVRAALSSRSTDHQILVTLQNARKPLEERLEPLPPLGEVSLKELVGRLAQELQLGLVDTAVANARTERVFLGEGTQVRAALWSALAQIRGYLEEQSDGKIRFERGPDGSIPLAPGPVSTARRSSSNFGSVDLTGRRILVADDDPAVAWLVSGTLRAAGALVTETHDGQRALELCYRLWPELVISDVLMPGLDGFALCHALKRDVLLRDTPVVLLSWKEDLLFRLRDLGSDADGYLRKEATASSIVQRAQELLRPRHALERRLTQTLSEKSSSEVRGRLDDTTVRLLLETATTVEQPLRIALRDATAIYDIRVREGALKAVTRTRIDGTVEHGSAVLGALIGVTAGRFSVTIDHDPYEPHFDSPLNELLRPVALRARAAQRVLSGLSLGLVEQLVLDRETIAEEMALLPLSLRPVADELLRGASPRQLLATGTSSIFLLESLLSDIARRGAVRSITSTTEEDLLEQEIVAMSATPQTLPSKPAPAPTPLFTFQLSPAPPPALSGSVPPPAIALVAPTIALEPSAPTPTELPKTQTDDAQKPPLVAEFEPSGTLAGVGKSAKSAKEPPHLPVSTPPSADDVDWAMELNWDTTPLGNESSFGSASESPSKGPTSSIGFMRPTLPTLSRQPHNETPDLANAVAKAVSEVTPSPVRVRAIPPPAELDSTKPEPLEPRAFEHETRKPESLVPVSLEPDALQPESVRTTATQTPKETKTGIPETPDILAAVPLATAVSHSANAVTDVPAEPFAQKRVSISQNETPLIALESKPASPTRPDPTPNPSVTTTSPLVCPPPLAGIGNATLGITRTPTFGGTVSTTTKSKSELVAQSPPSTVDAPKLELVVEKDRALDPSPGVTHETHTTPQLPAVQKPPRPDGQRSPILREHDSDPVFPLVSTAPQSITTGVDVQPAIEISDDTRHVKILSGDSESTILPNRDTLRSPGDSTAPFVDEHVVPKPALPEPPEPPEPVVEQPQPLGEPAPASQSSQTESPSRTSDTSPLAPPSTTSRTSDTSSLAPPSTTSRTVSWLQALGLSLLAGVVTFAITVPIARWVRDRREANEKPLSALAEPTSQLAPTLSAPSVGATPAPILSADSQVKTQPSATIETIETPADVTLAPGQSLIEIVTAAGHAIFVDDSFVGRGPIRVVTVTPGRHVVRTRLNGVERSDTLEIGAGRSMRLSLEQAWK